MSTLSSLLPTSATNGTTSTVNNPNGFQSLTPSDFINMMVTQLENQDPLDPTNSQDILAQMSQIGQLQSATQLQSTLTGLTLQNQIGSASALIGKTVTGTDANNTSQTGTVNSVTITQTAAAGSTTTTGTVNLNLSNGSVLPLANVTAISANTLPQAAGTAITQGAATSQAIGPVPFGSLNQPATSN